MIEQIASYFKVSPAYLMGWEKQGTFFDKSGTPIGDFYGPTLRSSNYELKLEDADKPDPNAALRRMTTYMSLLTEAGQNKAIEQIELLTKIPEYQKEIANKAPSPDDTSSAPDPEDTSIAPDPLEIMAAHDRIDVEITPEGRQHDIDLMNDDSKWGIDGAERNFAFTYCGFQAQRMPFTCSTRAQDCARANNILTTAASRAATLLALSLAQEGMLMSTYEEFMIILAFASLIVAILNFTHKK